MANDNKDVKSEEQKAAEEKAKKAKEDNTNSQDQRKIWNIWGSL